MKQSKKHLLVVKPKNSEEHYVIRKFSTVLKYLRTGHNEASACKLSGIARKTFNTWLKKYPSMGRLIEDTLAERVGDIESSLWRQAKRGRPWAMRMFLEANAPEKYLGNQEVGGPGVIAGITINLATEDIKKRQEERKKFVEDYERKEKEVTEAAKRTKTVLDVDGKVREITEAAPLMPIEQVVTLADGKMRARKEAIEAQRRVQKGEDEDGE